MDRDNRDLAVAPLDFSQSAYIWVNAGNDHTTGIGYIDCTRLTILAIMVYC